MTRAAKYNAPLARVLLGPLLIVSGSAALGQQGEGGLLFTFDLNSRLETNDNLAMDAVSVGRTTTFDNRLAIGMISRTRTTTLEFNVDGVLRSAWHPSGATAFGFDDSSATLAYTHEGASSRLEANAAYYSRNLTFLDWTEGDGAGDAFINDNGTRETHVLDFGFETGIDGPLGFELDLSRSETTYAGTSDPDLYNSRNDTISGAVRLSLSERTDAKVTYVFSDYVAQDLLQTTRTSRALSFGVTHALSPVTEISASIGRTDITEVFGAPGEPDTSETGLTADLSLTRDLATGTFMVSLDHAVESTGPRTSLQVERAYEWPTGNLTLGVGLTALASGNIYPTASLQYLRELPTGELNLALSHGVSTNSDDLDALNTSVNADYSFAINDISRLAFAVDIASVADAGGGGVESELRGTFSTTYSREISDDLELSAGYRYDFLDSSSTAPAHNNRLFVSINRGFSFRP